MNVSKEKRVYGCKEIAVPMTDLSRNVYVFSLLDRASDMHVRLTGFRHEVKPTKRHQWRIQQQWNWYNSRDTTCPRPAVSDELYAEAVEHYRSCVIREPEAVQPVTGGRG